MNNSFSFLPFLLLMFTCACMGQNAIPDDDNRIKDAFLGNKQIVYTEHNKVTCGLLDKQNTLWFGTNHEGIYRYKDNEFQQFTLNDGLSSNAINCMAEDHQGNLWLGTDVGLCKYDGKQFTHFPITEIEENNDPSEWWNANQVQCITTATSGDIWFGTAGFGVYQFDGESFINYSFANDALQSDGAHHNFINSMMEDDQGDLWFTSLTHGGITRYDGIEFKHFTPEDGLLDDFIYACYQDLSGQYWFGGIQTQHYGMYRSDGVTFKGYTKEDGLCDNFVTGFFEDKNGLLWVLTGNELCAYDGEYFHAILDNNGEEIKGISTVLEDQDKNVWIGGKYGRLWKLVDNAFVDYSQKGR